MKKVIKGIIRYFNSGERLIANAVTSFDKTVNKLQMGIKQIEKESKEREAEVQKKANELAKAQTENAEKQAKLAAAKDKATAAITNINKFFGKEEVIELTEVVDDKTIKLDK